MQGHQLASPFQPLIRSNPTRGEGGDNDNPRTKTKRKKLDARRGRGATALKVSTRFYTIYMIKMTSMITTTVAVVLYHPRRFTKERGTGAEGKRSSEGVQLITDKTDMLQYMANVKYLQKDSETSQHTCKPNKGFKKST